MIARIKLVTTVAVMSGLVVGATVVLSGASRAVFDLTDSTAWVENEGVSSVTQLDPGGVASTVPLGPTNGAISTIEIDGVAFAIDDDGIRRIDPKTLGVSEQVEFDGTGVTVNVVVPGGPADTPMVPQESGFDRAALVQPAVMAPPIVWLCSDEANGISGNRYVAAHWDPALPPAQAERRCRAPIAWTELAQSPVWPGGKPPA